MAPTSEADDPSIPEAARDEWLALLAASELYAEQRAAADKTSAECQRLVIALLRKGVRRRDLIGHPFSPALISRIQNREGITRRQLTQPPPASRAS